MLISHKKKFVFVHVSRTGGTTLRNLLMEAVPDVVEAGGFHCGVSQVNSLLGSPLEDYFKFAFVRNPWDRLLSWYSMIEGTEGDRPPLSFDEFLHAWLPPDRAPELPPQWDCLSDSDGALVVDDVGRFETFSTDVRRLLDRIEVKPPDSLVKLNRSDHLHYSDSYSDSGRDHVAMVYREDIEQFGYEFERAGG